MRKLFAGFLVAFILLGANAIWRVWAQTNTFCASNLPCTVSALWNFNGGLQSNGLSVADVSSAQALTSKTFDISANTLKTAANTAGHYPRNNGTQYIDATIAGADVPATTSNCSGVQFAQGLNAGHTPVCATPPTFVASGASHAVGYVPDPGASAGTTKFLREDATFAVPGGGVSDAAFANSGSGYTNANGQNFGETVLPNAHSLKRFTIQMIVASAGCSTVAVMAVRDYTASSDLTTLSISNGGTFFDSGAISVATTAGNQIGFRMTTGPVGCGTQPAFGMMTAVYQ